MPEDSSSRQRHWARSHAGAMGDDLRRSPGQALVKGSWRGVAKNGQENMVILTLDVYNSGCRLSGREMVAPFLRARASMAASSGTPLAPQSGRAASSWSPQAPHRLQLWRAVVNRSSSKFLLGARVWFLWIKIQGKYATIYRGFCTES
jgi:hypothetical protein